LSCRGGCPHRVEQPEYYRHPDVAAAQPIVAKWSVFPTSQPGEVAGAHLHASRASTCCEVMSAWIWGGHGRARKDRVEGVQLLVAEQAQINPDIDVDR
jgi:hypothetical protein